MDERTPSRVADIGELGLIQRVRRRLGRAPEGEVWAGDDTAVLNPERPAVLLTTDLLVEGVDFDNAYSNGGDVGWKALAASASDIAAMCGRPSHAVVALGVPGMTTVDWVDEFLDGLMEAAAAWDIAVVGGDISAAKQIVVTVSMLGAPVGSAPVLRSGARPGDTICVTGALGGAAAGLIALRSAAQRSDQTVTRLIRRQLRPRARVSEAAILAQFEISAMIDISDGLVVDLGHLLDESGVGCHIDEAAIPVDPDIAAGHGADPFELALLGGEDFELLLTMNGEQLQAASDGLGALGTPLTAIGTVTTDERRIGRRGLDEWRSKGWEHLRSR
jgi:thiamine-monophosphate kinase